MVLLTAELCGSQRSLLDIEHQTDFWHCWPFVILPPSWTLKGILYFTEAPRIRAANETDPV